MEDDTHKNSKANTSFAPIDRQYKCPSCPSTSSRIDYFTEHVLQMHGKFKCPSCNYTAHTKNPLKRHLKEVHTTGKSFSCNECDYKAKKKAVLKAHLLHIHLRGERKKHECSTCPFVTYRKGDLVRHYWTHDEVMKFRCALCNSKARFSNKKDLDQHVQGEHELVHCSQCEYQTRNKFQLKRHMLSHFNEIRVNCPICDRGFTSEMHLQKHINNVHENNEESKPYQCQICNKRFIRLSSLNVHVKLKHGGVEKCPNCTDKKRKDCKLCDPKPFKCTICDYATDYKRNLHQHYYIHNDIKPFQCEACGKQFTTKANLRVHMNVHDDTRKQKRKSKKGSD